MRSHGDPDSLIASPDVDAVVLASPGFVHEEQVLACLRHGKPVLCEKPLSMDDESSLRLLEAESSLGRRLVTVGFMRRFDPEYAAVRAALRSGAHGRLLLLHNVHRNRSVPNADFRSEMIVRDSLVHEVDASRFLFGDEVVEVHGAVPGADLARRPGVVDPQVSILRMSGGGLVTNEVFVNSQVGYEVRFEAVAERGSPHGRPRFGRGAHHPGRRRRRVVGRLRARRLPRPASPAPTTSRCRPGPMPCAPAPSWARRPGTATPRRP